jgi:hypothetical protein
MRLEKLGKIELTYTDVDDELTYAEGGHVYGILKGTLEAGDLSGTLHVTNITRQRPDGAFTPTLRGMLTTPEGAKVFVTIDGISILDPTAKPPRRIVTAGISFWTPESRLHHWNDTYLVAEMVGRSTGKSWGVAGTVHRCIPEL